MDHERGGNDELDDFQNENDGHGMEERQKSLKKAFRFHKTGSTIAGAGWTKEMLGATHGWESRCLETIGARVWKGLSRFS